MSLPLPFHGRLVIIPLYPGGFISLAVICIHTALGIEAPLIIVEVHLSSDLSDLTTIGLSKTAVRGARDQVRSALVSNGYAFPTEKITISLTLVDLPKEGGRYNLPIALVPLIASEQLNTTQLNQYELVGGLALTDGLRGVPGTIPSAMEAIKAGRCIIVPSDSAAGVGLTGDSDCLAANHPQQMCVFLTE